MKYRLRDLLKRILDWFIFKSPRPIGSVSRFAGKKLLRILVRFALLNSFAGNLLDLIGRAYRPANDFVVLSFGLPGSLDIVQFPAGRLKGYKLPWHKDFTIGFMLNGGIVEKAVSDAAERVLSSGGIVLDLGANLGFTGLHFADLVGPEGKVFAFEPDPELASRLERVREVNSLPQFIVRREAVSSECGQARFIIGEESYLGRLAGRSESVAPSRLFLVKVISIDWFVVNENISRVDFVKIDVQGSELDVLLGMQKTLSKYKPTLVIEFDSELEGRGVSFLNSHGYQCTLLERARPPADFCNYFCQPSYGSISAADLTSQGRQSHLGS